MIEKYNEQANELLKILLNDQQKNHENLKGDCDNLTNEIQRTRQRLTEESQQLEASIQLDISLEKKKREEYGGELLIKTEALETRAKNGMNDLGKELESVSMTVNRAIGAFVALVGGVFIAYNYLL